ncbi:MAG: type IV pilin biogenesis protein, partial [Myxococcales bacterium]|nr:type IV pilin biogenesis protein [Myxococcales bacterium]
EHVYGVSATANAGWIYDHGAQRWRHLAVFGLGPGGAELLALDVAHMGRLQDDDPLELLWTTSSSSLADDYAETLGQTWSRPALTYAAINDQMSLEPKAYLVFGSGYREGLADPQHGGRVLWRVDAATGETVTEKAFLAPPPAGTSYGSDDDIVAVGDIAVGSHCLSRYWGEMQEAYLADPAGRLYRWDLAAQSSDPTIFPHEGDSGGPWLEDGDGYFQAKAAFRFPACRGAGDFACTVAPIGPGPGDNKGEVFDFSPAVVANHRIDDIDDPGDILPMGLRDQFLLALISGSANDDAVAAESESGSDFHSSLYLLVDDHRQDQGGGFDIPQNAAVTAPGAHSHFMRLP